MAIPFGYRKELRLVSKICANSIMISRTPKIFASFNWIKNSGGNCWHSKLKRLENTLLPPVALCFYCLVNIAIVGANVVSD